MLELHTMLLSTFKKFYHIEEARMLKEKGLGKNTPAGDSSVRFHTRAHLAFAH